jgi:glycine cleavage system aminomethyltransferase T
MKLKDIFKILIKGRKITMSEFMRSTFPTFIPHDPSVVLYDAWGSIMGNLMPYEYTGWRNEQMAWKDTCYLGANLTPTTTSRIYGPDAMQFLKDNFTNSFEKFPVGKGKQGLMVDEEGYVAATGVLIRGNEDEFYSYWLEPWLSYTFSTKKYNAKVENLTGKVFLFQLAGPKSLQIIESASNEDYHDLGYLQHKTGHIVGKEIRVIRIGMAGSLAYEVHGNMEDGIAVYNTLWEAGQEYGIKKLGRRAYFMNHTLGGYPQAILHFNLRGVPNKGFVDWLASIGQFPFEANIVKGSMGDEKDLSFLYRTPIDLGWTKMIKFDHDFRGREVLEKLVANQKTAMVTLEWNSEDIIDIYRSQFEDSESYAPMDDPSHYQTPMTLWQDRVFNKEGKQIGMSTGREFSTYYKKVISLCTMDIDEKELGNEVYVLYGDSGTRQKKIRAKVARFPYFNEGRNQDVDVSLIPHGNK